MARRFSLLLLILALCAGLLLPTRSAHAQSVTLGEALDLLRASEPTFSENFRRDNGLWEVDLDSAESSIRFQSGTYRVGAIEPSYFVWGVGEVFGADLFLEVDATMTAGPLNNEFGIVFRHEDIDNYYTFLVSSDGYYSLRKLAAGAWEEILPWAETDLLDLEEGATNRVGVFAQGEHIALIINEVIVDEVLDNTFSEGDIGLAAGAFDEGGVEVAFDDLEMWDLAEADLPVISDTPIDGPIDEPTGFDPEAVQARAGELRAEEPTFSDTFRRDIGAWGADSDESVEYLLGNRQFTIEVFDTSWMGWSKLLDTTAADFLFEVDTTLEAGPEGAEWGVLFRYQDGDNFYFFPISGTGTWSLWTLVGDEWVAMIDWTESDAIAPGTGEVNRLSVLAEGNVISLLINGVAVGQVTDDLFAGGEIALTVGTFDEAGARVAFDNVDLWVINEVPVATATVTPEPFDVTARLEEIRADDPTWESDFRRDDGSWDLSSDGSDARFYRQRMLVMRVDSTGTASWTTHSDVDAADFYAEVDATFVEGPDDGEYGIVFRYVDGDFYWFVVSANGYYGLFRREGGEWFDVVSWTESDAIAMGAGMVNHLGVLAEGSEMALVVNDVVVATAEDDAFVSGGIGLGIGTFDEAGLEVEFDNYAVWDLGGGN